MMQRLSSALSGVIAAAVIVAVVVWAVTGAWMYHLGWQSRDQLVATEQSQADNDQLRRLLLLADSSQAAIGDYFLRRAATRVEYRTIREAIPHATTQYRPVPDAPAQPLPQCVFTRAFVGLWDHALTASVDMPTATHRAAEAATATDATGLLDSGLTQQDVLANHVDNAESCTAIRQQLNALIDWQEQTAAALH